MGQRKDHHRCGRRCHRVAEGPGKGRRLVVPTSRRNVGISGVAVTFGALGLWFVYAGIRDVNPITGLGTLLRGEQPPSRTPGDPYAGPTPGGTGTGAGKNVGGLGKGGDLGLVGRALAALPTIRAAAGNVTITGRGDRPNNPNSDHPKGMAMDVMTADNALAQRVIKAFKTTDGAHYWIWNGQLGDQDRLWVPYGYTKFGGHYDHVHLSWR